MIDAFLMGAIAMGFGIAGLFFLRFWSQSRDRIFALFALAFFVLAGNRVLLALLQERQENTLAPYLVRLAAFAIILGAIVDKNLRT
jgi:hypothetical protein